MDFNTTIETIEQNFSLVNSEFYDQYYGIHIDQIKKFFQNEMVTLNRQLESEIILKKEQLNVNWFDTHFDSFLNRTNQIILSHSHPEQFRDFQKQIFFFIINWVELFDKKDNELMELKNRIINNISRLKQSVDMWYSLYDLINEQSKQSNNLKKWNSFRPAGFDVAPHMLDILFDKEEKKENRVKENTDICT